MMEGLYKEHVVGGRHYDVVIIGAGITGALLANQLRDSGKRILILEAGLAKGLTAEGYQSYLERFYTQEIKVPNSPYPNNVFAPQSNVLDIQKIEPGVPDKSGYFFQKGPLPFMSSNTRSLGGTTLHWLGICLRMLPNDFTMATSYAKGVDWPINYWDLKKYYERAELEIGVSANTSDLRYPGAGPDFFGDYDFPMQKIPPTYLDNYLSTRLKGMVVPDEGEDVAIDVVSIPQGRNSTPTPGYIDKRTGERYQPVGAVGSPYEGQRCEGNSNCIPICPVQAKYNAIKTLAQALQSPQVEIQTQSVVSSLDIDESGKISRVNYQHYVVPGDPTGLQKESVTADVYILASSAIENAKILLASGARNTSGNLGANLMDHPYLLTWALAPDLLGTFRGPFSSSGIPSFRDGGFRSSHSAFRTDIGNWGWNFPTGAPTTDVENMVDQQNLFGKDLRESLYQRVQRQMRFGFLIEQLPSKCNHISIDPKFKDALGNYRPIINYDLGDYEKAGFAQAKLFSDLVYQRLGAAQYTSYNPTDAGYVKYKDVGYSFHGSGHIVGTHKMGVNKYDGVVDSNQKSFEHDNLYVVGCGSMPTIGTSNPTLTMAALALKTADAIAQSF